LTSDQTTDRAIASGRLARGIGSGFPSQTRRNARFRPDCTAMQRRATSGNMVRSVSPTNYRSVGAATSCDSASACPAISARRHARLPPPSQTGAKPGKNRPSGSHQRGRNPATSQREAGSARWPQTRGKRGTDRPFDAVRCHAPSPDLSNATAGSHTQKSGRKRPNKIEPPAPKTATPPTCLTAKQPASQRFSRLRQGSGRGKPTFRIAPKSTKPPSRSTGDGDLVDAVRHAANAPTDRLKP
jgi:hypothetical protein